MTGPWLVDMSVEPEDDRQLLRIVELARSMGFAGLGLELKSCESLGRPSSRLGVTTYPRVTFEARGKAELSQAISRAPASVIVSVAPVGLEAFRYAARSRRVDVIRVNPRQGILPDRSTLNLFRAREGGALEVPLRPLLYGEWGLRDLREVVVRAWTRGLRLAIVSGARRAEELWHPSHIVGLLGSLGLPPALGLLGLTSAPGFVISRRGLPSPEGVLGQGP